MTGKPTPLEILMTEFLPPAPVAYIREPPKAVPLGSLKPPEYGNDPNELLKHRFLYRGGIMLLSGPTGAGKSSLLMQAAVCWSAGKAFFGIVPGDICQRRGMRILLVQAENDEGDLAEMYQGVKAGCGDLTDAEKALAGERIMVKTTADRSAEAFAEELDALLAGGGPYDLVIVDPAFAYLGGDSNSQKDVSHFMRELMNPLLQRHRVGMVLAHHTNKPLRGKEKEGWAAGDFAYLGAGSAEWINPARAALAIRSLGSDDVFELRAAKRGRRLRWTDAEGRPTTARLIAHDTRPGVICWHEATPEEAAELEEGGKGGRPKQYDSVEAVHAVIADPGKSQRGYAEALAEALGWSHGTAVRTIKSCVEAGWLREAGDARRCRYQVTEKGAGEARKQPSRCSNAWNTRSKSAPQPVMEHT